MVISGRLIVHAPVRFAAVVHLGKLATGVIGKLIGVGGQNQLEEDGRVWIDEAHSVRAGDQVLESRHALVPAYTVVQ